MGIPNRLTIISARLRRFAQKPWHEKRRSLLLRCVRHFPRLALPVRLPHGGWWLLRDDVLSAAILSGGFENSERLFVERYLQPGMNVLDIGANQGFYTVLASSRVGPRGQIIAFEPSPNDRQRLQRNLRMNRCRNVRIESCALSDQEGEAELFVIDGFETGCNSLRPPAVSEPTRVVKVQVMRLDSFLQTTRLPQIDFVKLDVEGAEIGVLRGAGWVLERQPRPVILIEVEEIRTRPWGYPAAQIVECLCEHGYTWFQPLETGELLPVDSASGKLDGIFVAVPPERLRDLGALIRRERNASTRDHEIEVPTSDAVGAMSSKGQGGDFRR